MTNIIRKSIQYISRNKYVFKFAQRVAFDHRGEKNCKIKTNGELIFLRNNISKFETVFDVGANVGEWTNSLLEMKDNIKVHSFEPVKDTFSKLKEKVKSDSVVFANIALGDENKKTFFNIYGTCSVLNSFHQRKNVGLEVVDTQEVDMVKLDDYCKTNNITSINLVKIDVEGCEFETLKGAYDMLNEGIDVVQFEYGGAYIDSRSLLKDVFKYLTDLSFNIYKILPHKLVKVEYQQSLENFQNANFIAVNKRVAQKYDIN